jgi:hypothetical protein
VRSGTAGLPGAVPFGARGRGCGYVDAGFADDVAQDVDGSLLGHVVVRDVAVFVVAGVSTTGHEQAHDPWPWLTYFASALATAYATFESRGSSDRSTGTKHGRVRDYVVNHASDIFKISDIRVALPGISGPTVRLTLEALKREGQIAADGTGRSAVWWKSRSG